MENLHSDLGSTQTSHFYPPTRRPYVVLDTETTGLHPPHDELLEIGVVGPDGAVLFHTYLTPERNTRWDDAEEKNGLSPAFIFGNNFPRFADVREQLVDVLRERDVVIYNASFDARFLDSELREAHADTYDCMEPFAEFYGDWHDYHQNNRWQRLTTAASCAGHQWQGDAHGAVPDALATLDVWRYLTEPTFRVDVDARKQVEADDRYVQSCIESLLWNEADRAREVHWTNVNRMEPHVLAFLGVAGFIGNRYLDSARRSAMIFCRHLTGYELDTWQTYGEYRLGLPSHAEKPAKLLDERDIYWMIPAEKRPKPVAMLKLKGGTLRNLYRPARLKIGVHYVPFSSGSWPEGHYSESTLLRQFKIGKKAFSLLKPAFRRFGKDMTYYLYHYNPTSEKMN